jgi:hypothetical protein
MCTPSSTRRVRLALALRALCTLALASAAACERAPTEPSASRRPLGLAEIRIAEPTHAIATLPVPALPGAPPPSRYAASDRPIGWEAMLAERAEEIEQAGGTAARPSAIGGGPSD